MDWLNNVALPMVFGVVIGGVIGTTIFMVIKDMIDQAMKSKTKVLSAPLVNPKPAPKQAPQSDTVPRSQYLEALEAFYRKSEECANLKHKLNELRK